jgi:hypothetical protein
VLVTLSTTVLATHGATDRDGTVPVLVPVVTSPAGPGPVRPNLLAKWRLDGKSNLGGIQMQSRVPAGQVTARTYRLPLPLTLTRIWNLDTLRHHSSSYDIIVWTMIS